MRIIGSGKVLAVMLALSLAGTHPALARRPDEKPQKREAVPENILNKAEVPGFKDIRAFADEASPIFKADLIESIKQESEGAFSGKAKGVKSYAILAISGGGANGAYGAGIISGWTKSGTRPDFKIITGISTGALIAPFVFLGPEYDNKLREMYTAFSTDDIMSKKAVININNTSSLADNRGLANIMEQNVTEEILSAVAEEHKKGKRLYVGTTNLDAQRLVVWDMGKIASVGGRDAVKLFRDVLLASAAIPIVFPPTFIDVVADGKEYQEIHMDGGTVTQVVAMAGVFKGFKEAAAKEGIDRSKMEVSLYVIRNGYLNPQWRRVRSNLPSIAESSMDTLIKTQGVGDIYRIYGIVLKKDIDFNLAYIPDSYQSVAQEMFDPKDMTRLFDMGFDAASKGYPWEKKPPRLAEFE